MISSIYCLWRRHNRRAKVQPRRLCLCMFVAQMPIHLADENPTVLVADPAGNRHVINSAHYGVADEKVTAIVKTNVRQA